VLFIVNAYGVPMSWEQRLGTIAIMLVTSKGAATVFGGSFVVFAATVTAIGLLPVESLALLFGVYRFMVDGDRHLQHHRQQRGKRGGVEVVRRVH